MCFRISSTCMYVEASQPKGCHIQKYMCEMPKFYRRKFGALFSTNTIVRACVHRQASKLSKQNKQKQLMTPPA